MPFTERTILAGEQQSVQAGTRGDGHAVLVGERSVTVENALSETRYRLMKLAIAVWGDKAAAFHWMSMPHMELQGATPESLLGTAAGIRRVENLLSALENGFPV